MNRTTNGPATKRLTTKRWATKGVAVGSAVVALGLAGFTTSAGALASGSTNNSTNAAKNTVPCKGAAVKPVVHADATRHEGTLTALVGALQARKDPYGVNGAQISALQAANASIAALDAQIASTCYPTLPALKADATKLFVDYRVYWLRVPQSKGIEAADHLAEARSRLGNAAAKLAPLVGSNAAAQADLAAMNQALATADAKLGTPPAAGPNLAPVPGLQPATDMTHDTAVLQAAHDDLLAARAALVEAHADGAKVVADLQSAH